MTSDKEWVSQGVIPAVLRPFSSDFSIAAAGLVADPLVALVAEWALRGRRFG